MSPRIWVNCRHFLSVFLAGGRFTNGITVPPRRSRRPLCAAIPTEIIFTDIFDLVKWPPVTVADCQCYNRSHITSKSYRII